MSEGPIAFSPSREKEERNRDAATPCGAFCAEFSVVIDGPCCCSGDCLFASCSLNHLHLRFILT